MALFHIDPEDEARECPSCGGSGDDEIGDRDIGFQTIPCGECRGTGRIGGEKEPEIEVHKRFDGRWYAIAFGHRVFGSQATEEEALAAARAALGGK